MLPRIYIGLAISGTIGAIISRQTMSIIKFNAATEIIKLKTLQEIKDTEIAKLQQTIETMQTQIQQLGKLSQVGQLAAGVAHELNTPLATIITTARLLGKTTLDDEQKELMEMIVSSSNKCAGVTKKLLLFTRQSTNKAVLVNLEEVINDTLALLEHQLYLDKIAIAQKITSVQKIKGDVNEFSQVFANLILNARDAIVAKLSELEAFQRTLTYTPKITISLSSKGESVIVDINDNGIGISAENLGKIFQPFFTTKDIGKGTGLGLSISQLIIHKWGGQLDATSTPSDGTHFTITLPKAT